METARLQLRPLTEADLDELVELDGFAEVRTAVDPFGDLRVMEKIGMSYAAPWSYRGLVGAEYEARPPDGADATPGPRSAPVRRP